MRSPALSRKLVPASMSLNQHWYHWKNGRWEGSRPGTCCSTVSCLGRFLSDLFVWDEFLDIQLGRRNSLTLFVRENSSDWQMLVTPSKTMSSSVACLSIFKVLSLLKTVNSSNVININRNAEKCIKKSRMMARFTLCLFSIFVFLFISKKISRDSDCISYDS